MRKQMSLFLVYPLLFASSCSNKTATNGDNSLKILIMTKVIILSNHPVAESKFSIDKTTIELDYGGERDFKKVIDSLTGTLQPPFDNSEKITYTYTAHNDYSLDQLKVIWSIDSSDTEYFTVTSTDSSGKREATLTATNPSKLSTLTASLVEKSNESNVIKTLTC